MTYTQMLFALSFDKLIFGHSPNWTSIIGSSLILGPAIFVAVQKSDGGAKEGIEGGRALADEESQQSLMNGMDSSENGDRGGSDRMPFQEVQLRTLR